MSFQNEFAPPGALAITVAVPIELPMAGPAGAISDRREHRHLACQQTWLLRSGPSCPGPAQGRMFRRPRGPLRLTGLTAVTNAPRIQTPHSRSTDVTCRRTSATRILHAGHRTNLSLRRANALSRSLRPRDLRRLPDGGMDRTSMCAKASTWV